MTKVEAFFKEKELKYEDYQWKDLAEMYNYMLRSEDNLRLLLSITSDICILIALFGVWSMIMLTCEQRRKEIAVRKVFGSGVAQMRRRLIGQFLAHVAVAALPAVPLVWWVAREYMATQVVRIVWWPWIIIAVAVVLLVSWMAVAVQSRMAAAEKPVKHIKDNE